MGWSLIGVRMRAYKANGGSLKGYYRSLKAKRKAETRTVKFDKRVAQKIKRSYDTIDPDTMICMPYLRKAAGFQQ